MKTFNIPNNQISKAYSVSHSQRFPASSNCLSTLISVKDQLGYQRKPSVSSFTPPQRNIM